jgi:hypothetical protein
MKIYTRLFTLISVISIFYLNGCQQEATEIIEIPAEQVITPDSKIAGLVQRTAMNDGSKDNIIDKSSSTSLVLPITIIVNGIEIILDSNEDLETVENIIDKFDFDDDVIKIIFPVTVILADHSEITISNADEMEVLINLCEDDGYDDDIECIDFVYPFTISVFDSENQLSDAITIEDDKDLHNFFAEFDEDELASINFPITVVLSNGEEFIVTNNEELEELIDSAIDACDEDDDNDHNDDDVDDSKLKQVLIEGVWVIDYFFHGEEKTTIFKGYIFDFLENGIVEASLEDKGYRGEWSTNGDDGTLELELFFGDNFPLGVISEDWDLIEFNETIIKLMYIGDSNTSKRLLTFKRPKNDVDPDKPSLSEVLIEGQWLVAKFQVRGDDITNEFEGFSLDFIENGTVVAAKNNDEVEGTWFINNDKGDNILFDFGDVVPLNEFNEDWEVESVEEKRVEFHRPNDINDSYDVIVLEKTAN